VPRRLTAGLLSFAQPFFRIFARTKQQFARLDVERYLAAGLDQRRTLAAQAGYSCLDPGPRNLDERQAMARRVALASCQCDRAKEGMNAKARS
jgi:hypothetical protein